MGKWRMNVLQEEDGAGPGARGLRMVGLCCAVAWRVPPSTLLLKRPQLTCPQQAAWVLRLEVRWRRRPGRLVIGWGIALLGIARAALLLARRRARRLMSPRWIRARASPLRGLNVAPLASTEVFRFDLPAEFVAPCPEITCVSHVPVLCRPSLRRRPRRSVLFRIRPRRWGGGLLQLCQRFYLRCPRLRGARGRRLTGARPCVARRSFALHPLRIARTSAA